MPTVVPSAEAEPATNAAAGGDRPGLSADLQLIVRNWSNLSAEVRAAIVTLAQAAMAGSAGRGADA